MGLFVECVIAEEIEPVFVKMHLEFGQLAHSMSYKNFRYKMHRHKRRMRFDLYKKKP